MVSRTRVAAVRNTSANPFIYTRQGPDSLRGIACLPVRTIVLFLCKLSSRVDVHAFVLFCVLSCEGATRRMISGVVCDLDHSRIGAVLLCGITLPPRILHANYCK